MPTDDLPKEDERDTEFFKYPPAYRYSRGKEYEAIDADSKKILAKLNAVLNPYIKAMYRFYRLGVIGFNLTLLVGFAWLYWLYDLYLGTPAEDAGFVFWKHVGAILPPLVYLAWLGVWRFLLNYSQRLFRRDVLQIIRIDFLHDLYAQTLEAYADFTREQADFSSVALFDLMSLRVRNIQYWRDVWLIALILNFRSIMMRHHWTYLGFGIPAVVLTGYACFKLGASPPSLSSVPTFMSGVFGALFPGSVWNHVTAFAIIGLAFAVYFASNWAGRMLFKLIEEVTEWKNYPHWDIKTFLKKHDMKHGRRPKVPVPQGDVGSEIYEESEHNHLRPMTHDMSAFIVEHYHDILARYLRLRDMRFATVSPQNGGGGGG